MPRYRDDEDDRPRRRRDDDDDDRPVRSSGGGNTTVKVLLIVGGVIVLLVLICSGVALYVYTSVARGVNEMQQKMQVEHQRTAQQMREEHDKSVKQIEEDGKRMREDSEKRIRDQRESIEKARRDADQRRQAAENRIRAQQAIDAVLAEVRSNRVEEAYKLTTAGFRSRVRLEEFRTLTAIFVRRDDRVLAMRPDQTQPADGKSFTFTSFGGRRTSAKMTVVNDGSRWLIDQFTVENQEPTGHLP